MSPGTLERRTELKRTGWLRRVSAKKRKANRAKDPIRQAVFERDGGCVLSPYGSIYGDLNPLGSEWGPCLGELTYHHLLKEGQGGEYTVANGRCCCSAHNSLIEDFPEAAHRIGLVIKSWEAR